MPTKGNKPTSGYWQGQIDAKLEAVASAVNETKLATTRLEEKLDALRLWKAKVAGVSLAASAIGGALVTILAKVIAP
jgi:hypothetical protein